MSESRPVTIITGAGSGIGRGLATLLSSKGHALALVGRRAKLLDQTAAACKGESLCLAEDIAVPDSAGLIARQTYERFGRVDNLVNNAGFAPLLGIDRTTPEVLEQAFQINALGPARLISACWPSMVAQRSGCIVNTSTLGTVDPFPGFFAYAAAKSAVNSMARSCALEGKPHNIRAFAIAPGAVETDMLRANFPPTKVPPKACLAPDAVAELIAECIEGVHNARNGRTLFITAQKGVFEQA